VAPKVIHAVKVIPVTATEEDDQVVIIQMDHEAIPDLTQDPEVLVHKAIHAVKEILAMVMGDENQVVIIQMEELAKKVLDQLADEVLDPKEVLVLPLVGVLDPEEDLEELLVPDREENLVPDLEEDLVPDREEDLVPDRVEVQDLEEDLVLDLNVQEVVNH